MATKKQAPKLDPLDALATGDPLRVIALMLWKNRHREPDMYVQIEERDLEGFNACVDYLKVKPAVLIKRPPEIPGQPAIPAQGNRRAVPARPSIPARPYVMVSLVELGKDGRPTENAIRPVENNEDDYDQQRDTAAVRRAKDNAPHLANMLLKAAASGDYSVSDMQDAANALQLLARAV